MTETTTIIGTKYNGYRDVKDIAKDIRKDLKAAGIKANVRIERFSMGQSITANVKEVNGAEVKAACVKAALEMVDDCNPNSFEWCYRHCVEKYVEEIMDTYNRRESDLYTDYMNYMFYSHANYRPVEAQ